MNGFTLIVPYYRNPLMLQRQVEEWNKYSDGVKVVCVDDGSPEPARQIIENGKLKMENVPESESERYPLSIIHSQFALYRIQKDIPWNRGGARNLGAHVAQTDWIVHVDIDHILPADAAAALLVFVSMLSSRHLLGWYRFRRYRVGKADETRKKDQLPDDAEYGPIHPHVDSYLIHRDLYWKVGGYDEDYSGCLGGGNMFLKRLEKLAGPPGLLGESDNPKSKIENPKSGIRLEVYTRHTIKDASDWSLSRDKAEYSKRRRAKEASGNTVPKNPLRFEWKREL